MPGSIVLTAAAAAASSSMSNNCDGGQSEKQKCQRIVSGDVELDAAMDLGTSGKAVQEELASTRLSLELVAGAPGFGPRPRRVLTEAEKEVKRLRRVLANRESARQTILRRQAIRDELARKVADLSSQNESMKKEKETVMQEYMTLEKTNKQLKEQQVMASASGPAPTTTAMATVPPGYPPYEEEHEDTDDDPCSLTLGRVDVDRRTGERGSRVVAPGTLLAERERARKKRRELTKLKQMDSGD